MRNLATERAAPPDGVSMILLTVSRKSSALSCVCVFLRPVEDATFRPTAKASPVGSMRGKNAPPFSREKNRDARFPNSGENARNARHDGDRRSRGGRELSSRRTRSIFSDLFPDLFSSLRFVHHTHARKIRPFDFHRLVHNYAISFSPDHRRRIVISSRSDII